MILSSHVLRWAGASNTGPTLIMSKLIKTLFILIAIGVYLAVIVLPPLTLYEKQELAEIKVDYPRKVYPYPRKVDPKQMLRNDF